VSTSKPAGRRSSSTECRGDGRGIADAPVAHFAESGARARVRSIPRRGHVRAPRFGGPAVLVGEDEIVSAARPLLA